VSQTADCAVCRKEPQIGIEPMTASVQPAPNDEVSFENPLAARHGCAPESTRTQPDWASKWQPNGNIIPRWAARFLARVGRSGSAAPVPPPSAEVVCPRSIAFGCRVSVGRALFGNAEASAGAVDSGIRPARRAGNTFLRRDATRHLLPFRRSNGTSRSINIPASEHRG